MCIELGLHRRESLFKVVSDPDERANVIKLFWSIYVLDRRWSFGTGLPFALQDADIDPILPEPVSSTLLVSSKPYRILNYIGAGHSLSQCNDLILSYRLESLAINLLLLTNSKPLFQHRRNRLPRLPNHPVVKVYPT